MAWLTKLKGKLGEKVPKYIAGMASIFIAGAKQVFDGCAIFATKKGLIMPLWGLFKSMTGIGVGSKLAKTLYGRIVTQARISLFYEKLGVVDTLVGRIDMLALHVIMSLEIMSTTPSWE